MTSEDLRKLASEMWELDYEQSEATILKVLKKVRDETIKDVLRFVGPCMYHSKADCKWCPSKENILNHFRALKEKKE